MANWKDELMKGALKALQNPRVQKVMSSEKFQKGMQAAFKASYSVKSELDAKKEEFARKFNLATRDDLRTMKRELDRLQRQVSHLKKEQGEKKEGE